MYKSDPLPSYQESRNCSHSIKLSYITSSSTPQIHLPRLGPTIVQTGSSLGSALPPCTAHIWVGRPPFTLWRPVSSLCKPWWGGYPQIPLHPLRRGTPTLRLYCVYTSSPWSITLPGGGTPPGPWAFTLSPHRSFCRTILPTALPPYTSLLRPAPLLLSVTAPLLPLPIASKISAGFGRPPPNRCYCRRLSVLGMENLPTVVGSTHLSETRPYFPLLLLCAVSSGTNILVMVLEEVSHPKPQWGQCVIQVAHQWVYTNHLWTENLWHDDKREQWQVDMYDISKEE